ncbi:MAG: glycosyltransferase family 4 protein [Ruthenibacterium sp.]
MTKRILVVSQHYWPENFRITDICRGLLEDDIAVDVLCGLPNYPQGEWFDGYCYTGPRREIHDGIELFRAGEIRRKGNTGARIFLNYVSFPLCALFSLPRLHGRRYDAVLCYNTSPVLMLLPALVYAKLHRIPLIDYVLDLWPENLYSVLPIKNRALRAVASGVSHWFYRRCDGLISMSPALCERLRTLAPKARHTVIAQYCEDFYFSDTKDAALEARFAGRFNVLFAGNFSPAQDLDLLVQCAARLKAEGRRNIHFVLVGDGMSRAALEESIAAQGLSDWFTLEGQQPVTAIPAYQSMADVLFCALSKSADLGLTVPAKLTSYFAAAKPCLVAIDGEGARVVKEAGAGLFCGAGDADALYRNLLSLADMPPQQRASLGENARAYCKQHYGRAELLRALEAFLFDADARRAQDPRA